jgi:hypothetical protein
MVDAVGPWTILRGVKIWDTMLINGLFYILSNRIMKVVTSQDRLEGYMR